MTNGRHGTTLTQGALAAFALAGTSHLAYAQDAGAAASSPVAAPTVDQPASGEVVVTAERRESTLERTPISLTAIGGADLAARKIDTPTDLIKNVPGLIGGNNVGNSNAAIFFIRGLGQDDSSPLVDPAVGVYVDDVYVARQFATNLTLYDTERVEVLRGPQGVLYGRNTTGGAIRFVTVKPSSTFSARLEGEYGNYDSYQIKGSVNLPVTDTLFVRASLFTQQRQQGFVTNLTTGEPTTTLDNWGGRIQVRAVPTDRLTIDLSAERLIGRSPGDTGANIDRPTSDLFHTESGLRGSYSNLADSRLSATVAWEGDALTIKSISSYDRPTWSYMLDFSGEPNPLYVLSARYRSRIYSQELQFTSDLLGDRLHLLGGLFGFYEKGHNQDGQNVFGGLFVNRNVYTNTTRSLAAYGQARFDLTSRLHLSAGLRYTNERRTLDINGFAFPNGVPTLIYTNADLNAAGNATTLRTSRVDPKFGIEFQANPHLLFYGSFTKGFRSGSFNQRAFSAADISNFAPEVVKAYEIGIKGAAFDRRVRGSVAVFRNDYDNFIINRINPNTGNFVTANAAQVRIQGVEAEGSVRVVSGLTLRAAATGTDASYRKLAPGVGITLDNQVRFTPKFTLNLGADWEIAGSEALSPRLTVNYYHSSRYYVGLTNFASEHVPVLDLLDAQFGIKPTRTTTLSVFCKNCRDQRYLTTAVAAPALGFDTQTVAPPRQYGVRLAFSY